MQELQLYAEDSKPLLNKGGTKDEIWKDGLLHGASHVWIWRKTSGLQILVQKRAASKPTWPNFLDISAAGHIDFGETPQVAAVREMREEIGLKIDSEDLNLIKVHRAKTVAPNGNIENGFKWLYTYEFKDVTDFNLQAEEVASLAWIDFETFKHDVFENNKYVPQGEGYFETLTSFLEKQV